MKKDIHPELTLNTIRCSCGNEMQVHMTKDVGNIEVCSKCHPFFTGEQKFIDVAGRVEKFQKKFGSNWKKNVQESKGEPKEEKKATEAEVTAE